MTGITLVIESTLNNVRLIGLTVNKLCSNYFQESDVCSIELSVVEAITNIVKHSYPDSSAGKIKASLDFEHDVLRIQISDSGISIDKDSIDITGGNAFDYDPNDQENLPEGGLGLALINNCMDDITYETKNGINTMTLIKQRAVE